jgi:hypothetical protein
MKHPQRKHEPTTNRDLMLVELQRCREELDKELSRISRRPWNDIHQASAIVQYATATIQELLKHAECELAA